MREKSVIYDIDILCDRVYPIVSNKFRSLLQQSEYIKQSSK